MKYTFVLPILYAVLISACTFKKTPAEDAGKPAASPSPIVGATSAAGLRSKATPTSSEREQEKELEKIAHWFEQMDAVLREGLWVLRKERSPQGKSIFGKMHRALTIERKLKLANKSLFSCDVYSMSRKVSGVNGVPQSAEVFQKCSQRESFVKFGDWNHASPNELTMNFQGNQLAEVLGMVSAIFNPKISCKLKSHANGLIEKFSCENLMLDYDRAKNQVLKITRFEFVKSGKSVLHLRAEVLENLEPIRKIEADVPVEGAILVTETVLKAPEVPKPVPAAVPVTPPAPLISDGPPPANHGDEARGSIQARPVPSRGGSRGGPPVPIEAIGRSGPPGGVFQPPPLVDANGNPIPQEQQEGEYHEGGPLPSEQYGQGVEAPPGNATQPGQGAEPLSPSLTEPMPELGTQPR